MKISLFVTADPFIMKPELTYGPPHQSFHPKCHSFNKLLRSLDGSLEQWSELHSWIRTKPSCFVFFSITNQSDRSYKDQTKALAFTCVSFQHSYLIGLIEESFKSFRQPSDQAKRIPKYVQAKHQYVHLFNSLK